MNVPDLIRRTIAGWRHWQARRRFDRMMADLHEAAELRAKRDRLRKQHRSTRAADKRLQSIVADRLRAEVSR